MALTHRDRVGRALDLLSEGLGPFIGREVQSGIRHRRVGKDALPELAKDRDASALLKAILDLWHPVFQFPLGPAERSLVHALKDARNRWAHQQPFSWDETYRMLDQTELLLIAVSARQAAELAAMKDELHRLRFEERARGADRRRKAKEQTAAGPIEGLTPWREVITPHEDVFGGRYQQAEFAADLHAVHDNPEQTAPEYGKPRQFFQRTHLTGGLKALLGGAVERLRGAGGDPVVDLQTNFGGGKTHSMLALYHLFSGTPVSELPGMEDLLADRGAPSLPENVRRVVLVGNRISPGSPQKKPDGTIVRTLWGEIAWQLGGKAAYARLRTDDERATNPGAALGKLLADHGPCLILVDEWVAYARQLQDRSDLPGGSFETQFSFAQNLTESVKQVGNALLVISLPASSDGAGSSDASDEEVGGMRGREALGRLRNVLGRVASSWKPATAEEGFEIVRRRLFQPIPANLYKHRDQTARRFAEHYREHRAAFPAGCGEKAYRERIEAAYPIHPEVFDRLYEDWAPLLRFQRTRGVLRLMAAVIHELWQANDQSPLILPSLIPLEPGLVRSELVRYLSDPWEPILDQDVDGDGSLPERLDEANPAFGRTQAARRVARAIFLGSAPKQQAARLGIEASRIRLGCALPGLKPAVHDDALRRLTEGATFLYPDGSRYWYSPQPTVAKLARDRAEELRDRQDEVLAEVERRLRAGSRDREPFAGVHVAPRDSGDVPDERRTRLVILSGAHRHTKGPEESPALAAAREHLERRGNQPRIFQNALLFLVADETRWRDLDEAVRALLAWESILEDEKRLDLAHSQIRQAKSQKEDADRRVEATLPEAWRWLLVPGKAHAGAPVAWQDFVLGNAGGLAERAGARAERADMLLTRYGHPMLRQLLDSFPLWRGNQVAIRELSDNFAKLLELPRLVGPEVLAATIEGGLASLRWKQEGFAFAEDYDEAEDRYLGLNTGVAMRVSADAAGFLVRPDAVPEPEPTPEPIPPEPTPPGPIPPGPHPDPIPPKPRPPRRYHGSVELDPDRLGSRAAEVADEVVAHLAGLDGAAVRVTLEIEAERPEGFPERVVRIVRENGGSLRFATHGFEDD